MLRRVNPSVKLVVGMIIMLLTLWTKSPLTTGLLLAIPLLATWLLGDVSIGRILKRLSPFLVFFLLYIWTQGAFARITNSHILFEFLWYKVSLEGLVMGLTVALRMLVFVSYGLLFVLTTDITQFVLSLMQQLHVPPKLAYGLLAGFRFIPMFRSEFEQIRLAHRIRGMDRQNGLRGKWEAAKRYAIPLLAQAIRKAERVAIAMESKGFTGEKDRIFYKKMGLGKVDIGFILGMFTLNAVIMWM